MARIRYIKHDFFLNESLSQIEPLARLLFIGLWTLADREGRLEDRPVRIRVQVFPYDDLNVDNLLRQLEAGFITRYEVDGKKYIQINNFSKHQRPHLRESKSSIPPVSRGKVVLSPEKVMSSPLGNGEWGMGNGERRPDAFSGLGFLPPEFLAFWNAYPKQINQAGTKREWEALSPGKELLIEIMGALALQNADWKARAVDIEFIPHPASWLRDRRWNDKLDTAMPPPEKQKPCPRCRITGSNNRPNVKAKDGGLICQMCADEEAVLNGE